MEPGKATIKELQFNENIKSIFCARRDALKAEESLTEILGVEDSTQAISKVERIIKDLCVSKIFEGQYIYLPAPVDESFSVVLDIGIIEIAESWYSPYVKHIYNSEHKGDKETLLDLIALVVYNYVQGQIKLGHMIAGEFVFHSLNGRLACFKIIVGPIANKPEPTNPAVTK